MSTSIGVDLGSAHIGVAIMLDRSVTHALTIGVTPDAIAVAVSTVIAIAVEARADVIVIEHAPWFARQGAGPAELIASQRTWTVTHDLHRDLLAASPIPVVTIGRQTWAHRVVPHHRGGVRDADVLEGLRAILPPESIALLTDQHQRDAAGAVLGHLLAPPPPAPREARVAAPRPRGPRDQSGRPATRNAGWLARRHARTVAAREAAGCTCPVQKGRHRASCPCHRPRAASAPSR